MLHVVTKKMFFDRQKVLKRLDQKRASVLARTGGFARKAMQRSMRYKADGGKPSKPGKPPKARRRFPLLRELIAFGFDKAQQSVVVGPLVKRKNAVGSPVPKILNDGGSSTVVLPGGETERVRYLPRPFATPESPAGQAGQKKFEELTESTPL